MNKVLRYFKGRNFWWWFSNSLLIIIIILILSPGLRATISSWFIRYQLKEPTLQTENTKVPEPMWNWEFQQVNGDQNIQLKDLKNEVVFINVWATWCPPCIAEMELLQSLYDQVDSDVRFIFVSFENKAKIEHFLANNDFSIPIYQSDARTSGIQISSYPTTFIIREGKIIVQEKGAARWDSENVINFLNDLVR